MTVAAIQINDIALLANYADFAAQQTLESAGLALLLEDELKIGNPANELARLHPRKVNDSFWQSPGIEPLETNHDSVRHHSDLIYHHLKQLHSELSQADQIILAVPGSMSSEQLSYVLGVAEALPFSLSGLCDLAVAGVSDSGKRGSILHYDIQRHQTVITAVDSANEVVKKDLINIPNLGHHAIQDKWANLITDSFVEQSRFDPMHTAESEQQLYNMLPQWMEQLVSSNDITMEFVTRETTYQAKIERSKFARINDEFIELLLRKGRELAPAADHYLADHRLSQLLTLSGSPHPFEILPRNAVIRSVFAHLKEIISEEKELPLVTSLNNLHEAPLSDAAPQTEKIAARTASAGLTSATALTQPTHLLVDNSASPLPNSGDSISLLIQDNHLITATSSSDAIATVKHQNGQLSLDTHSDILRLNNKVIGSDTHILESGDILSTAGGLSARVITVVQ